MKNECLLNMDNTKLFMKCNIGIKIIPNKDTINNGIKGIYVYIKILNLLVNTINDIRK